MTDKEHHAEIGQSIHVHHIEPYDEFDDPEDANDLDNLVTLCSSCHGDRHSDGEATES